MAGRVEADAESYELPYEVLVARDSDIIETYQIVKLPRVIVIARGGTITYTQRYAPYETLRDEVNRARGGK